MRSAELEAAIEADPEDERNFLVYADWLTQQGDPRGELISVQHALARGETPELRAREAEILHEQVEYLVGAFPQDWYRLEWRLGFLRSIFVNERGLPELGRIASQLERIFENHSARFLDRVRIGVLGIMDTCAQSVPSLLEMIGTLPISRRVRHLSLGEGGRNAYIDNAHVAMGNLEFLADAFPALESFHMEAGLFALGDLSRLPLTSVKILSCGLVHTDLQRILACKNLETLHLGFGSTEHAVRTDVAIDDLQPILDGSACPRVVHLGIQNTEMTEEFCVRLLRSPIVPRLKSLDLSYGTLTDKGAELLSGSTMLRHLERLEIGSNHLSPAGLAMLRTLPFVTESEQQKSYRQRYVTIWE